MAKKNDNTFLYGSQYIPSAETKYRIIRWGWNGIDKNDVIDSGKITDSSGVICDPPYIVPALKILDMKKSYSYPIGLSSQNNKILALYRDSEGNIAGDYFGDKILQTKNKITLGAATGKEAGNSPEFERRTVSQFNVATGTENIVQATYDRKMLFFPDKRSSPLNITSDTSAATLGESYPSLKYGAVYCSRLFGVTDNYVFASKYNDYAGTELDTADDTNTANAWVSMSQSNVKADGKFTAIASYDNHVVLFKRDFMQLVYNNKNPFRIVDVGEYGCVSQYAVCESGGVMYFVSPKAVYAYGGGTPKRIDKDINITSYPDDAALGAYGGALYMGIGDKIYVYKNGAWSVFRDNIEVLQFASTDSGIYALTKDGKIYALDYSEDVYSDYVDAYGDSSVTDDGAWWFETDFFAAGRIDVRRVKKISLMCEIDNGADVSVYLLKDGEKWSASSRKVLESNTGGMRMLRQMIRQTSGYIHRVRICGHGKVKFYALELQISYGGDLYVDS